MMDNTGDGQQGVNALQLRQMAKEGSLKMRCRVAILTLFMLAAPAAGRVCAQATGPVSTLDQQRQSLSPTAHPSLFAIPDASQAFEQDVYPAPEFLPPEVYRRRTFEEGFFETDPEESGVQQVQYPTIDSAARDEDPAGHSTEPRWNPIPFLQQQLANLPQDEHGLICKEFSVTDTVLTPSHDSYSMNSLDLRSTLYFGQLPILQFTPRFSWHVIGDGGPVGIPPQFFDAGLDTTLYLPLSEKWSFLGMAGPSIFSDGQNTSSQAFRMTGRALAFYQWSKTVKLSGGFLYLGRADIKALPAGGIFYQPHGDFKVELFFPRPKIAWRFHHAGEISRWCYLAGEFGGNSWAIERSSGLNDIMTLRDYRLVAGLEHIQGETFRGLIEAGFVFGRKIEYTSGVGNTTQSPTAMLRGGLAF